MLKDFLIAAFIEYEKFVLAVVKDRKCRTPVSGQSPTTDQDPAPAQTLDPVPVPNSKIKPDYMVPAGSGLCSMDMLSRVRDPALTFPRPKWFYYYKLKVFLCAIPALGGLKTH